MNDLPMILSALCLLSLGVAVLVLACRVRAGETNVIIYTPGAGGNDPDEDPAPAETPEAPKE